MKSKLRVASFAACLVLATAWGNAGAQAVVPLVTGETWTTSSEQLKKAYLIGIANAIQVETAFEGANPPSDAQSLVPRLSKGDEGSDPRQRARRARQVIRRQPRQVADGRSIETIWFEFVVPGLQKAN